MFETRDEVGALQHLLDVSRQKATEHLRGIIHEGRILSAADVVALLDGMKVITVATVTARSEPRISAVDGHFLHATWTWSTSGSSAKARDIEARPSVSVAHVDNEEMAVFAHGRAQRLSQSDDGWDEVLAHWTGHYGGSPLGWGPDIRLYQLAPSWMVAYAAKREDLLRTRGLSP
jgi:general stress protein 26